MHIKLSMYLYRNVFRFEACKKCNINTLKYNIYILKKLLGNVFLLKV